MEDDNRKLATATIPIQFEYKKFSIRCFIIKHILSRFDCFKYNTVAENIKTCGMRRWGDLKKVEKLYALMLAVGGCLVIANLILLIRQLLS